MGRPRRCGRRGRRTRIRSGACTRDSRPRSRAGTKDEEVLLGEDMEAAPGEDAEKTGSDVEDLEHSMTLVGW